MKIVENMIKFQQKNLWKSNYQRWLDKSRWIEIKHLGFSGFDLQSDTNQVSILAHGEKVPL